MFFIESIRSTSLLRYRTMQKLHQKMLYFDVNLFIKEIIVVKNRKFGKLEMIFILIK